MNVVTVAMRAIASHRILIRGEAARRPDQDARILVALQDVALDQAALRT